MEHLTNASLEHLPTRISYLKAFLEINNSDAATLQSAQPLITPLIPSILSAVYSKLLSFDITAKSFVPNHVDIEGRITISHPDIVIRKDFLRSYLIRLLSTNDFSSTSPFWTYLNRIALMHTGQPSFSRRSSRPDLQVDYIHMALLLGYLLNLLIDEISILPIEEKYKRGLLTAVNKVLWVQNDLFARQYSLCAKGQGGFERLDLDGRRDEKDGFRVEIECPSTPGYEPTNTLPPTPE